MNENQQKFLLQTEDRFGIATRNQVQITETGQALLDMAKTRQVGSVKTPELIQERFAKDNLSSEQFIKIATACLKAPNQDAAIARLDFIKEECKKTGLFSRFSSEKIDDKKLDAVIAAFDSPLPPDRSKKGEELKVAAWYVAKYPDSYEKGVTNKDFISKVDAKILQENVGPASVSIGHYATVPQAPSQYSGAALAGGQNQQPTTVQYDQSMPTTSVQPQYTQLPNQQQAAQGLTKDGVKDRLAAELAKSGVRVERFVGLTENEEIVPPSQTPPVNKGGPSAKHR